MTAASTQRLLRSHTSTERVSIGRKGIAPSRQATRVASLDLSDRAEPPEEAVSRPGDLWVLGDHAVLCGDCCKPESVARLMQDRTPRCASPIPPGMWPSAS